MSAPLPDDRGRDLAALLARPSERGWLERGLASGPLEIRARGVSMRPLLRPGDRVRIERRPAVEGDVALVALPERLVLHRLIRRRGRRWLVRGDARDASDGWVDAEQVIAVATARRRSSRWVRLDRPVQRWLAGGVPPAWRQARRLWHALGVARSPRRTP